MSALPLPPMSGWWPSGINRSMTIEPRVMGVIRALRGSRGGQQCQHQSGSIRPQLKFNIYPEKIKLIQELTPCPPGVLAACLDTRLDTSLLKYKCPAWSWCSCPHNPCRKIHFLQQKIIFHSLLSGARRPRTLVEINDLLIHVFAWVFNLGNPSLRVLPRRPSWHQLEVFKRLYSQRHTNLSPVLAFLI